MRASAVIAGVLGAAAGYGAAVWIPSRAAEPPPPIEAAPTGATANRWNDCLARLDAIDARLATLSAPAAAAAVPTRVAAEEPGAARIEERLAAIEATLGQLVASMASSKRGRDDPPRAARDGAVFDRLFEAEYAKRQVRRDDHLGYTAERLYDRYGAPDFIHADPKDETRYVTWGYNDSNGSRGVTFGLRNGLVVDEGAWMK
ncbi:MAG TPA: hypothetical protein VFG37_08405 [Planctomycetota bacterium]|jgi:hypothetical protein|nr:hypothetical protein [Planctomycetota bacterium]